jgi:hypothetical protein
MYRSGTPLRCFEGGWRGGIVGQAAATRLSRKETTFSGGTNGLSKHRIMI